MSGGGTILALFLITSLHAQLTLPAFRQDINELTNEQLEQLAGYISDWLTSELVEEHVDDFSNGVHNTHNFLPWHRVWVRNLEDYLLQQPGGAQFVPLPRWIPFDENDQPNPIPYYFNGRTPPESPGGEEGYYYDYFLNEYLFDEMGGTLQDLESFPFLPNVPYVPGPFDASNRPTFNWIATSNNIKCDVLGDLDIGRFSNQLEGPYHSQGHNYVTFLPSSQGNPTQTLGEFSKHHSNAYLLFWPWHAWVDEIWYWWEQECDGEYTQVGPITVNGAVTWTGTQYVKGEIIIESGGHLTIAENSKVHFQDSEYFPFETNITVKDGGRLSILNNATLSGMSIFGDYGVPLEQAQNAYGVAYKTPWDGIIVDDGGIVSMYGSRLEHARTGLYSPGGGAVITATNCDFLNNRKDVVIGRRTNSRQYNGSSFIGCNFINDQVLRDVAWESEPIGAGSNAERRLYVYNTTKSKSSENHVELYAVHGVNFADCLFDNTFRDTLDKYESRGIYSYFSQVNVLQSEFLHQTEAIHARGFALASPDLSLTVRQSTFSDNLRGIVLDNMNLSYIEDCTFSIPGANELTEEIARPTGISASGRYSDFIIRDNDLFTDLAFTDEPDNAGILVDDLCRGGQWIARNNIANILYGTESRGGNIDLQISCNDFEQVEGKYAIAVTSGLLENQGDCGNRPAGNAWDASSCVDAKSQIYLVPGAGAFEYRYFTLDPAQIPNTNCVSTEIALVPCFSSPDNQFCQNIAFRLQDGFDSARLARILTLEDEILEAETKEQALLLQKLQQAEVSLEMRQVLAGDGPEQAYEDLKLLSEMVAGIRHEKLTAFARGAGQLAEMEAFMAYYETGSPLLELFKRTNELAEQGLEIHQQPEGELAYWLDVVNQYCPDEDDQLPAPVVEFRPDAETGGEAQPGPTEAFVVYPNPTSALLHIRIADAGLPETGYELWLNDWRGATVMHEARAFDPTYAVPTVALPSGAYFLTLEMAGKIYQRKVIIAH